MKTFKAVILFVIIIGSVSCKNDVMPDQLTRSGEMPGKHIQDMEIDNKNEFYFVTSERDTSIDVPLWSSSIPTKSYLAKKTSESSEFEIIDNNFIHADEIIFDKKNNLWGRNGKTIFLREGQTIRKILELTEDDGLFNFFAVDKNNNIWAGGYTHGLYKIDSNLNVELLTPENSPLPKSSMTDIHVDKNNTIWIAMDGQGVLKITNDNWIHYNSENSNITTQRIWCLVADKDDNIWIGTGFNNNAVSLMRFDGQKWETINPRNDKNENIYGAVRRLYSDDEKIYVVSEQNDNKGFFKNVLVTFDGNNWNRVDNLPEDDGIADIKIDNFRNAVWVRTLNNGIIKLAK